MVCTIGTIVVIATIACGIVLNIATSTILVSLVSAVKSLHSICKAFGNFKHAREGGGILRGIASPSRRRQDFLAVAVQINVGANSLSGCSKLVRKTRYCDVLWSVTWV